MVRENNVLGLLLKLTFFSFFICPSSDLFSFKDGPVQNYEGRNTLLLCHAITSLIAFLLAWLCPPEPRFHFRRDLIANGIPKKVNTFPLLADPTAKSMQK